MKQIAFKPRAKFTGGILAERAILNYTNLFRNVDSAEEAACFTCDHDEMWADAEFAGKYMDISVQNYLQSGDISDLERAKAVVESILVNQRADGYLGAMSEGLEGKGFSIWNQFFAIWGLTAYWDATGDERALEAAIKCGKWIIEAFTSGKYNLFDAINQGSEHITILPGMCKLYERTGLECFREFAYFILDQCEKTPPYNLLTEQDAMRLATQKGIEMFIVWLGVIDCYRLFGDERCLNAAIRHWENLREYQITLTGCGTIAEMWTPTGNRPAMTARDLMPNENCVAVGWMEMSARLYEITGDARYYDACERSLYNHFFGSQAIDGSDFAYYQGNYGRKEDRTLPGLYKCCRFRGMTIFAHLPEYSIFTRENGIALPVYASMTYNTQVNGANIDVEMKTDYPRSESISICVTAESPVEMDVLLRIPEWCKEPAVSVNGIPGKIIMDKGHAVIRRVWEAKTEIRLTLPFTFRIHEAIVDDMDSVAIEYGPLLLSIDSRYGTPIYDTAISKSVDINSIQRVETDEAAICPMVRFELPGQVYGKDQHVTLVDYASAGALDNTKDRFRVWIPLA